MTPSHWDRLPDNIKGLVYQFDSTVKIKFDKVLNELWWMVKDLNEHRTHFKTDYCERSGTRYVRYLLALTLRRKYRHSKYLTKLHYTMRIPMLDLEPNKHNNRADRITVKKQVIHNRWLYLVNCYLNQITHFAKCMKRTIPIYKRILN